MILRDYQIKLSTEASEILIRKKLVYLNLQVRVGKTLIALQTCQNVNAKKVLFITKIKAFSSIQNDYDNFGYDFNLTIINKESIHKIETNDFDVIICDEAHGLFGTYPKPNKFTKIYKKRFSKIPAILLSGTISPESYSQLFHQFWINDFAPFREYTNFYKWAHDFVDIEIKNLGYAKVNDYSKARKDKFFGMIKHYILTYTQEEAGFESKVNEMVLYVDMKPQTYNLINKLKNDLFIKSEKTGKTITADTSVKLQQKMHQMFSGTIKLDDATATTIDDTKARYILDMFKDKKIGIFYNFVQELQMLKDVIGTRLTTSLEEFNTTDKWIALQIVSGREGISLAKADCLVMLNIQFSAVSYFQSVARLTTKDRKENDVFWIFANKGIEANIYKRVMVKLDYTLSHFVKDFDIKKKEIKNKRELFL
jgi:hypothetical protein